MKIREHGIQTRERSRIYKMRPKCDSDGKNFGSVRLIDCHAAFLVLVYGFAISFVTFCVEKFLESKLSKICPTKLEKYGVKWANSAEDTVSYEDSKGQNELQNEFQIVK